MNKIVFISIILIFLVPACGTIEAEPVSATQTLTPTQIFIITATLPATSTSLPTQTPLPVLPTATFAPVEGQTTSQINVRRAPSDESDQIGQIEIFTKVQIVGKDSTSKWWMILFPESENGFGWVSGGFVQVADGSGVPVVEVIPEAGQNVPITEASPNASVSTATLEPTPALVPIPDDGDSLENPAVNITLAKSSVPFLEHQSELSFPDGDTDDWVQFALKGSTGEEQRVSVVAICKGSGRLGIELLQNGVVLQKWGDMTCGQPHQLQLYLYVSAPYTLHLFPLPGDGTTQSFSYDLTVQLVK